MLRGRGSSGAFATQYEYSLYSRDEKQGRQYRVRAAGRWEDMDLKKQKYGMREWGLTARIAEDPILDSYREYIWKLWLSNISWHGFK